MDMKGPEQKSTLGGTTQQMTILVDGSLAPAQARCSGTSSNWLSERGLRLSAPNFASFHDRKADCGVIRHNPSTCSHLVKRGFGQHRSCWEVTLWQALVLIKDSAHAGVGVLHSFQSYTAKTCLGLFSHSFRLFFVALVCSRTRLLPPVQGMASYDPAYVVHLVPCFYQAQKFTARMKGLIWTRRTAVSFCELPLLWDVVIEVLPASSAVGRCQLSDSSLGSVVLVQHFGVSVVHSLVASSLGKTPFLFGSVVDVMHLVYARTRRRVTVKVGRTLCQRAVDWTSF
ncbi:uncharacterized protein C8R40DRAFT_866927 [Lentinula edodes]|uniref:uncharacterized protein n=1 Tax=Lentinula edodes TaxID=5353 RepID=UPI001E8E5772|nr:uncharacterized protein C8R40DRAFT_866927 [Lentinula edodes]KAH7877834.1 hypothetical protein C8R40DRAFT_866927 [Lentinula edodes]